jgi:hypothetical protein
MLRRALPSPLAHFFSPDLLRIFSGSIRIFEPPALRASGNFLFFLRTSGPDSGPAGPDLKIFRPQICVLVIESWFECFPASSDRAIVDPFSRAY